jgi:hypothetical protein
MTGRVFGTGGTSNVGGAFYSVRTLIRNSGGNMTDTAVDHLTLTQLCAHAKEADKTPADYYRAATS